MKLIWREVKFRLAKILARERPWWNANVRAFLGKTNLWVLRKYYLPLVINSPVVRKCLYALCIDSLFYDKQIVGFWISSSFHCETCQLRLRSTSEIFIHADLVNVKNCFRSLFHEAGIHHIFSSAKCLSLIGYLVGSLCIQWFRPTDFFFEQFRNASYFHSV